MKIAYLGPEGTFTEEAMWQLVAQSERENFQGLINVPAAQVQGVPVASPAAAVAAVHSGEVNAACLAIENSVDGYVTPTYDALAAYPHDDGVQIYDELYLPIRFAIMARPGTDLATARTLATHPVAYQQIRQWLADAAPHLEFQPASSNGAAAAAVAAGDADIAAAPARAAELYGLETLVADVADFREARTRFVLVGPKGKSHPPTGQDHTSVMFVVPNEPGALASCLAEFSLRGVDLTRIESRPSHRIAQLQPTGADDVAQYGPYRFHIDLAGHIDDAAVAAALQAVFMRAKLLCFFGSWPSREQLPKQPNTSQLQAAQAWLARAQGRQATQE